MLVMRLTRKENFVETLNKLCIDLATFIAIFPKKNGEIKMNLSQLEFFKWIVMIS